MPGPLLTFEGHNNTCSSMPPDSDGDVGPNHYVEAVNESIKIFDKNGNTLSGPTSYNSFFSGLTGTPCANANDGDPFVLYDPIADRWLISDFAFPSFPGQFILAVHRYISDSQSRQRRLVSLCDTSRPGKSNIPWRLSEIRHVERRREPSSKCLFLYGELV